MKYLFTLLDKLEKNHELTKDEWIALINGQCPELKKEAEERACRAREPYYGHDVYTRGLIEFTNYCKNDCYYCGIRCSNKKVNRYRLSNEEIMRCCQNGYDLGFRTFVLQGGEDPYYNDDRIVDIVSMIHRHFPECAITLSIGEKNRESYQKYFDAGAKRYLLRHETASEEHYAKLHPDNLSGKVRKNCLKILKDIGYQVGAGFMVGAPFQTASELAEDMIFLKELNPAMIGIGPFIPHHDTRYRDQPAGSLEQTLFMLSLIRLMIPKVLLPSTTALGSISPIGRELGMKAGANVLMPNLSPTEVRKDYLLYDNKICIEDNSSQCRNCLEMRMEVSGYRLVDSIGDSKNM